MANDDTALAEKELVIVELEGQPYGVDISAVQEIIRMQPITKVPMVPFSVEGIINLRGKVIAVVDLRKKLGLTVNGQTNDSRIAVVNIVGESVGLVVDAVAEVARIPADAVETSSAIITTADSDYLIGIAKLDGKLITLIDLERIIPRKKPIPRPESPSTGTTADEDSPTSETASADLMEEPASRYKDEQPAGESDEISGRQEMEQRAEPTETERMASASVEMLNQGISNAISGLSGMVGQHIEVTGFGLNRISVKDVADLFGGPEALVIGIYLEVSADAAGHIIVVYKPDTAFQLVDMLMGQTLGTTQSLEEMETSALGELGNIMASFFLNAVADNAGVTLHPSPPAVMMDMAGAVLDIALSQIMEHSDDTFIVRSSFRANGQEVDGDFLVLPSPELLNVLQLERPGS